MRPVNGIWDSPENSVRVVQQWHGLLMSSAQNSGAMRSYASAADGSRLERELSSPYTSSVFPRGLVS